MIGEDRLSVLGQASGELAPDRLEWTLVVRAVDADPRVASELLDDLYEQAVRAARRTAERMATAGGRTLGRMLSVRDPRADEADPYVARAVAASGTGGGEGPPVLARPRRLDVAVAAVFELAG